MEPLAKLFSSITPNCTHSGSSTSDESGSSTSDELDLVSNSTPMKIEGQQWSTATPTPTPTPMKTKAEQLQTVSNSITKQISSLTNSLLTSNSILENSSLNVNRNTTLTVKSYPTRSPKVVQSMSVKAGTLTKVSDLASERSRVNNNELIKCNKIA